MPACGPVAAWHRLARFLASELERDDVPEDLRQRYTALLDETRAKLRAEDSTPVERLELPKRLTTALARSGLLTVGQLAALPDGAIAALPGVGPDYAEQLRDALKSRALREG